MELSEVEDQDWEVCELDLALLVDEDWDGDCYDCDSLL